MGALTMASVSSYGAVVLVLAMGSLIGLARAFIAHRTRLHSEREASARIAARASGLIGLAERHRGAVRIVERDRDGHREVEFGRQDSLIVGNGEEAA
ncbi:hypothetical protein GCM10010172_51980 [Paractinoplanes ferrugineus]|uniref:Uncharacterized protein n=1 Tax=Paractinoplanes ferrugineus TaxID=113564 RepID=A0A919J2X3_9ACTN|nr:hypothetical protein [Actinoplanes ferrugineus]GIE11983.1 hypothetical protein Afe05nite_38230 [Actinoplanes ferrugineus]